MIKTTAMLLNELSDFARPDCKIGRLVKDGKIFPITRGLYETSDTVPGYLLAGCIYGPSYLSFQFALSYYGWIPEAVYQFTSATFEKKRKKQYNTPFGSFTYRDIPSDAFPYGVVFMTEGEYVFRIATAEKALCDLLYISPTVANQKEMLAFLKDSLRIDDAQLETMNREDILSMEEKYHCINIKILCQMIRRNKL